MFDYLGLVKFNAYTLKLFPQLLVLICNTITEKYVHIEGNKAMNEEVRIIDRINAISARAAAAKNIKQIKDIYFEARPFTLNILLAFLESSGSEVKETCKDLIAVCKKNEPELIVDAVILWTRRNANTEAYKQLPRDVSSAIESVNFLGQTVLNRLKELSSIRERAKEQKQKKVEQEKSILDAIVKVTEECATKTVDTAENLRFLGDKCVKCTKDALRLIYDSEPRDEDFTLKFNEIVQDVNAVDVSGDSSSKYFMDVALDVALLIAPLSVEENEELKLPVIVNNVLDKLLDMNEAFVKAKEQVEFKDKLSGFLLKAAAAVTTVETKKKRE